MAHLFIKIKNAFVFALHVLILRKTDRMPVNIKPNTLLLIRLDAIGDYILFRNFLEIIKNSENFKNYKITLCGNIIWKDIAEIFDSKFIDKFIWVDRKKFYSNTRYKYNLLKQIKEAGFETAIDMAYSREILYGDTIVRASGANVRIGSEGAKDKHVVWKRNLFSDKYYTEIIPAGDSDTFEFYRNKEFFEKILKKRIEIIKPVIDVSGVSVRAEIVKPYAVIFFGASSKHKIWDIVNFIDITKYLIEKYSYNIVLTGSKKEKKNSHMFFEHLPKEKLFDLCGETTLPGLAKVISDAEILISNESVATHISAAVNKKFVCISNGERIKRFHPYPAEIFDKAYYVYPDEIMKNLNNPDFLARYRFESDLDINSIGAEKVKEILNQVI